jgi:hypothetical protein
MLRTTGRALILAGVAVWGVFVTAWLLGAHPDASRYLPFHLVGVLPGASLTWLDRLRMRSDP